MVYNTYGVFTYSLLYTHTLMCKKECTYAEEYIDVYMCTHTYIYTRVISHYSYD